MSKRQWYIRLASEGDSAIGQGTLGDDEFGKRASSNLGATINEAQQRALNSWSSDSPG